MNKRVKILFILPSLGAGGSEKIISYIFDNINSNHFDPYLIISGFQRGSFYKVKRRNIIFLNKSRFYKSAINLIRLIWKIKPQILVSSSYQINLFLLGYNFFSKRVKTVIRVNSLPSKFLNLKNTRFIKIQAYLFKNIGKIIFQSQAMEYDFRETYNYSAKNTCLINNPIISKTSKINKKIKIPHFITIGSLTQIKGHKRILKSLSELQFDFKYQIIGSGILLNELILESKRLKVNSKVEFIGEQKDFSKNIFKNSIYLLGSYFEGFPNSVLEILSFGIPVISYNSPGGHNEIIIDGFNGFISKNPAGFSKNIEKAINFKWNRKDIKKDVLERFDATKILNQYNDLFLSLVKLKHDCE